MSARILVIEDDEEILKFIRRGLAYEGYQVDTAADGPAGLASARNNPPDLVVLDLMLPGIDGLEVCRRLRAGGNTPIIILTAKDTMNDRVLGLDMGADDYMTKPFSMRELMARVKAMLRRVRLIREEVQTVETPSEALKFGNLTIDLKRREANLNNKALDLKPKEYDLLLYFLEHPSRALSRDTLLEQVWGWDFSGDSRTVDVHIRWLREKIEEDPSTPKRLVTVRGSGYRFEG